MVIESERDDSPLDFGTAYRERVLGDICFRLDQSTIGGDDTPAPPASTLQEFHYAGVSTKGTLNKGGE